MKLTTLVLTVIVIALLLCAGECDVPPGEPTPSPGPPPPAAYTPVFAYAYATQPAAPTSVSLRDYIERILTERDAAHRAEIAAAEKTLLAANEALAIRLEAMNQFRAQIQEERRVYARQDQLEMIEARIETLENRAANLDGRLWALGAVLTVLTIVLNVGLQAYRSRKTGR